MTQEIDYSFRKLEMDYSRGRVVRALDLQFGGPEFTPRHDRLLDCSPEFKSSAMLIDNQQLFLSTMWRLDTYSIPGRASGI